MFLNSFIMSTYYLYKSNKLKRVSKHYLTLIIKLTFSNFLFILSLYFEVVVLVSFVHVYVTIFYEIIFLCFKLQKIVIVCFALKN